MYTLVVKKKLSKNNKFYVGLFAVRNDSDDILITFDINVIARLCKMSVIDVYEQLINGDIIL